MGDSWPMVVELVMVLFILAGLSILIGDYTWIIAGVGGCALVIFGVPHPA